MWETSCTQDIGKFSVYLFTLTLYRNFPQLILVYRACRATIPDLVKQ